jgi:hypothetical protein
LRDSSPYRAEEEELSNLSIDLLIRSNCRSALPSGCQANTVTASGQGMKLGLSLHFKAS